MVFVFLMALSCSCVFAQGNYTRGVKGQNSWDNSEISRREKRWDKHRKRYRYRDGHWYKRGWFGRESVVLSPAIGAMVESLPPRCASVVVEDVTYYHDGAAYYRHLPDGLYIVVRQPVRAAEQKQFRR